jgi:hypothetical protein
MRRGWGESPNAEDLDVRWMNVAYKAARTKRFKYVWASNGADMLFDTVKDPDERWNLIRQKPEIARRLRRLLERKLMSLEQRYFPDWRKSHDPLRAESRPLRRLMAWGLYQPEGVVAPWKE